MKWGTLYGADYVNRLHSMVKRNLTLDFKMVCFTDDDADIIDEVDCYPIPEIDVDPQVFTCREVSELHDGDEYSIIGRFGKYVLWNAHSKDSTLAQEKIKIDNAGYLLLPSESVPSAGATEFDGYNIGTCIQNIANNYKTNIMPHYQNTGPTAVFFPAENNYSNTYDSNSITNVNGQQLMVTYGSESELAGFNKFMVLIDPKL